MEGGREVKIVAVTASAFTSQREEVLSAGLDDFLRKPYRPREMFDCMARHLGVRYAYATTPRAAVRELQATLRPEDLAALPKELREDLKNAVISLDVGRIALLTNRISHQDGELGGLLARLADRFAYTPILQALETCKGSDTAARS